MQFPCELVVWKVLPAIKAQIAKNLKKKGMRQKKIAEVLDLTEPAISQYLSGKRATDFEISEDMKQMLEIVSEEIAKGKNPKVLKFGVCQVCKEIRKRGDACESCKSETGIDYNCDLCK